MGIEIERKFLVNDWWQLAHGHRCKIEQGYLSVEPARTVRVRVISNELPVRYERDRRPFSWAPAHARITVKGITRGATRSEYEFDVANLDDARSMIDNLCVARLEKIRLTHHAITGEIWEIDEFMGNNFGLVVAEIELSSENQVITIPDWIGAEVTHDPRYYNSNLAVNPVNTW